MTQKIPHILPVVLAGGSGARLWPLSRKKNPKQFLNLFNHFSLLQMTINLINDIPNISSPFIVANEEHRFIVAEQTRKMSCDPTILLESKSQNTAMAIAVAALYAMKEKNNPLLLILPADHLIPDAKQFASMITDAVNLALQNNLVVFGVKPTSIKTNYGYIQTGDKLPNSAAYRVKNFFEKPELSAASSYVTSGEYYWNSGIFLFKASCFLNELEKYSPHIFLAAQEKIDQMIIERDFVRFNDEATADFSNTPVDKAVFEQTSQAIVFPFLGEWHDIGDWDELYNVGKKDKNGNVMSKRVITFDTKNCYLHSNKQLLVTSGMQDCLIVATEDALLVTPLNKSQDIKKIVEELIDQNITDVI